MLFGLCHITDHGYVDLNELANFKGQMGLGIERDKFFTPKTLKSANLVKQLVYRKEEKWEIVKHYL